MTEHWTESDDRALRVSVLDLSRLLRCMERHEAPPDLSWQSIEGRANLALDLLRKVQDGFHAAVYESNALRAQDEARYVQLEHQVDRACRRAREIAAQRRENQVDLIQEIFFPKNDNLNEEEKKDNDADERPQEDHSVDDERSQEEEKQQQQQQQQESPEASAPFIPKSSAQDVEELQKAQREQLEAEIAHMAARLKDSTQQMNTTLRTQTEELDEMEDLATKNVEKVSKVADNVTDHNKKSWRNTLATWTIIFAVLGSFLFCMMTIRMVPKQRNKCLFFCGTRQEQVCNRMEDGSIVCVDENGNIHVKKSAPKSRREQEEAKSAQECEGEDNDECIATMERESNDLDEVSCSEEGECKAEYNEEPEMPEYAESDYQDGEHDQVKAGKNRQAMDRIVDTNHEHDDSLLDHQDSEIEDDGRQPNEKSKEEPDEHERIEEMSTSGEVEEAPTDDREEFGEAEDHKTPAINILQEQGSMNVEHPVVGGRAGELVETEKDATESKPTNEPTTQAEDHKAKSPTFDATHSPETSFKPAEIASQYLHADESFGDDGQGVEEFTLADVHLAAYLGQNHLLKRYLYLKPHYATTRDDNGWQPVHEAAREAKLETLAMLVEEYKADINARTGLINDGATPLYMVYQKGYDDASQVVQYIKSRGGISIAPGENMPYRSLSDHSPEELEGYNLHDFHLAAAKGDDIQVAQYIAVRPDLLEEGDENGFRAIHEAVRHGRKVSTQLLINAGADINARTGSYNNGWSPLGLAMHFFDEEHPVARLLQSRNAEVHLPGEGSA